MNAPFASPLGASLDEDATPRSNAHEFTVSELARSVKRSIEDGFGQVRVRGEIGNFRGRHSSGHAYFSLKDADACLDAVVWRSAWGRLKIEPEEGLEVIATGRLTTFAKKSSYQLVVDALEPAGIGALMKLLEERRQKLAAEGLFAEERKRPLPFLPQVVGVVTSPTGAVIRDILHRLSDRFPVRVVVWPVRVQGETAGAESAAAVSGFSGDYGGPRPDVIVVARGGGSVEDLWGFNDEALVRAVASSPIPVVSAVGHETDWTLVDHAADVRAPTPTGAAEMVVPVRADCLARVLSSGERLGLAALNGLRERGDRLRHLARGLPQASQLLDAPRQRLDVSGDRLAGALQMAAARARQRYLATASRVGEPLARRPIERASERVDALSARLARARGEALTRARHDLTAQARRLGAHLLDRPLSERRVALQSASAHLTRALEIRLADARSQLRSRGQLLTAVSHQGVLQRGFALVRRADDTPVRAAADIAAGEGLTLEFADGRVGVREGQGAIGEDGAPPAPAKAMASRVDPTARVRAPRRRRPIDERQGDLF